MILKIATTEIAVNDCYAYEHASGKRELRIQIPQTSITYEELKALLKGDTSEIVLTKDDGTTKTFCGYKTTFEITDKTEKGVEIFRVTMPCVAEAERRAMEAQTQVAALEKTVAQQANYISAQATEILAQAEVIVAQGETINTQNEQLAELAEMSKSQLDAIDFILTDGFSMIAQEAATLAVEQAMEAIAATEEVPEEIETEEVQDDTTEVEPETTEENLTDLEHEEETTSETVTEQEHEETTEEI